jgi:hypothetical protein
VTGIITERGLCEANEDSILALYPEFSAAEEKPARTSR